MNPPNTSFNSGPRCSTNRGGFSAGGTAFSTYVFPSSVILVLNLLSGTAAVCCFKLRTSASSSVLRFCNCSTARSSFSSLSDSEALWVVSGWMAASTIASSAIFLVEQCLVTNMILSYFTARFGGCLLVLLPDDPEKRLRAAGLRLLRSASFLWGNTDVSAIDRCKKGGVTLSRRYLRSVISTMSARV